MLKHKKERKDESRTNNSAETLPEGVMSEKNFDRNTNSLENIIFDNTDPESFLIDLNIIGQGSFGSVYSGFDTNQSEFVAIKQIRLKNKNRGNILNEVKTEIEVLKRLNHINCLNFYGCYNKEDIAWIVMEHCLGSVLDILKLFCSPFKEHKISAILIGTLKALDYLHNLNMIHRDIKAGNILITEKAVIKLGDFGSTSLTNKSNEFVGSPYWIAPEVIMSMDNGEYDSKADIWSLGITCIELANEVPPNFEMNPMSVLFKISQNEIPNFEDPSIFSEEFNDFVYNCLKKDPSSRLNAKQLLEHIFIANVQDKENRILLGIIKKTKIIVNDVYDSQEEYKIYNDDPKLSPKDIQNDVIKFVDNFEKESIDENDYNYQKKYKPQKKNHLLSTIKNISTMNILKLNYKFEEDRIMQKMKIRANERLTNFMNLKKDLNLKTELLKKKLEQQVKEYKICMKEEYDAFLIQIDKDRYKNENLFYIDFCGIVKNYFLLEKNFNKKYKEIQKDLVKIENFLDYDESISVKNKKKKNSLSQNSIMTNFKRNSSKANINEKVYAENYIFKSKQIKLNLLEDILRLEKLYLEQEICSINQSMEKYFELITKHKNEIHAIEFQQLNLVHEMKRNHLELINQEEIKHVKDLYTEKKLTKEQIFQKRLKNKNYQSKILMLDLKKKENECIKIYYKNYLHNKKIIAQDYKSKNEREQKSALLKEEKNNYIQNLQKGTLEKFSKMQLNETDIRVILDKSIPLTEILEDYLGFTLNCHKTVKELFDEEVRKEVNNLIERNQLRNSYITDEISTKRAQLLIIINKKRKEVFQKHLKSKHWLKEYLKIEKIEKPIE